MACDLFPVGVNADSCTESYAGTGTLAYLFFSDDVDTETLAVSETANEYSTFKLKEGKKIHPIRLKKQANKVVGTGLGDNKGFSNVATLVIDKELEKLSVLERTVQNKPCGLLLRKAGIDEGCYILWNPNVDTAFEFSTDSGDSYDSDMGSTWTVTSAPMPYDSMTISKATFAALTVAEESVSTSKE
jgi:hypothetical protein